MKKKTIAIIAAVLAVVIVIGAVIISKNSASKDNENNTSVAKTEEVAIRDLSESVGATGTIVSLKSRDITVSLSDCEIKAVYVNVGDTVKKNDVLATLDVSNAEESLSNAKAALSNAEKLNRLSLDDAQKALDNAKKARDEAKSDYEDAKKSYDKAVKKLENLKSKNQNNSNAAEIASQKELIDTLNSQLKSAKSAYESQENSVATAESSKKSTQLNQDTSTQEEQVKQYQAQVDSGTVKAPFDGTITAVNYEAGEKYSTATVLLTIQDCSSYKIEAEIGEYDISNIELGQSVFIKTDATGDDEMKGTVQEISPVSSSTASSGSASSDISIDNSSSSGSASYKVKISIDTPDDRLRLDMSAKLSIVIKSHKNALTVPYNAIYSDKNGSDYIKVVDDSGETNNIDIKIVMESNYYTEIRSDKVQAGMKVLVENQDSDSDNLFDNIPQGGGF